MSAVAGKSVCVRVAAVSTRTFACQAPKAAGGMLAQEDHDPWRPFWLPDAELTARGAVMDIVTVLLFARF